jgi:6-phosphogluconolactonase
VTAEIHISPDPARECAELLSAAAALGGQIVLTGGSTPRAAYEQAAAADWSRATVWFTDERCVAPADERSNYRMVKEALLDPLEDRAPHVNRIQGELGPGAGADRYESLIRENGAPKFDLVLLGLGPDAHIASLFASHESLRERHRFAVGVAQAGHEPFVPRITMTLQALAAAEQIVFLVTGAAKAQAVAASFGAGAHPDQALPATMLTGPVTVLLDPDAAGAM